MAYKETAQDLAWVGAPGMQYNSNPDPFNWKKIAADLKAEQDRKRAAAKRVQAAPQVKAAPAPVAPAPPPATVKELLDAYRAMNNGALPAGTTPEMAAMIDSGIWQDWSQLTANPALAQALLSVQHQIITDPAAYDAAKAQVAAQYKDLTGDVLTSGKTWMQDLYGRIVDPNDPNSALVKNDPALAAYGQAMSQIQETADANQATDLAWFDKMKQNALATDQGLLAAIAANAAVPSSGGGGGGGGGGFRRGGRRGGGGSGSNWSVPSTSLTNAQSATDTGTQTSNEYSPGFYNAIMEAAQGNPELAGLTQRMWETSSQDPRGLTQDVSKALTAAETEQEIQNLQSNLNKTWLANTPGTVQAAINKMVTNKGAILGDDPATKNVVEKYFVPIPKGQKTPPIIQFNEKQLAENALAEELLNAQSTKASRSPWNLFKKNEKPFSPYGVFSPEAQLERKTKGAVSPAQIKILAQQGMQELGKAKREVAPGIPFDWRDWAEGGGYVPPSDIAVSKKTSRNIDFYNRMLDAILPWNPNANFVVTGNKMTNVGKDTSTYKTTNKIKDYSSALTGSPLDLTPDISAAGIESNPVSNPQGFDIVRNASGKETVSPLGFGESRAPKLSAGLSGLLAKRAADIQNEAARKTSLADAFSGGIFKQPVRPRTTTTKTVSKPKTVATKVPVGTNVPPTVAVTPVARPRITPAQTSNLFNLFWKQPAKSSKPTSSSKNTKSSGGFNLFGKPSKKK